MYKCGATFYALTSQNLDSSRLYLTRALLREWNLKAKRTLHIHWIRIRLVFLAFNELYCAYLTFTATKNGVAFRDCLFYVLVAALNSALKGNASWQRMQLHNIFEEQSIHNDVLCAGVIQICECGASLSGIFLRNTVLQHSGKTR